MISCSLATVTLLLTACADPVELTLAFGPNPVASPARFADATPEQIERAIEVGGGWEANSMPSVVGQLLESDGSNCPLVTLSGDTTTIAGGCARADGLELSGQIIVTNWSDPTQPLEVRFESVEMRTAASETFALDGIFAQSTDGSSTASLKATWGGIETTTAATWRPAVTPQVAADTGGTVEVTGLGISEIGGSWAADLSAPSGTLRLHGADVLVVDFDTMVNDCAPITIDDSPAGEFCL